MYSALGVVAAPYLYVAQPAWRRFGGYLVVLAAAELAKQPAVVFPALLFVYVYLFEQRPFERGSFGVALRAQFRRRS